MMYFANPWGLLGLLAVPAILVIHLYHRRFPPLPVAGLHLWAADSEVHSPGRQRERLPITPSLLLELLAALLLTFLLSQPRFDESAKIDHLIVVLDDSASMSAHPPGEPSFRNAALAELENRVAEMDPGSVVTLILTGRRPIMLAGPAVPFSEARRQLAQWQPSAPGHDFQPAWDLAAQLAFTPPSSPSGRGAGGEGRLLFLTDHLPSQDVPVPRSMEIVSLGSPEDNVAITAARWSFDPADNAGRIFLRVTNLGGTAAEVSIRGTARDQVVFTRSVSPAARSAVPLQAEVPGGLGRLRIEIDVADDGLTVDNRVTLIEPKVRMLTVAVTLPEDDSALPAVRKVLKSTPDVQFGEPPTADLVIAPADALFRENTKPRPLVPPWQLAIGPLDRSAEARNKSKDLLGPFLLDKRNPLLEGVLLDGVIWGGVQRVESDVKPLISAGPYPLLARLNWTPAPIYVLNIDMDRSSLANSPDWPILMKNLLDLRRDNLPGLRRWNYCLNEEIRFRLAADPAGATGGLSVPAASSNTAGQSSRGTPPGIAEQLRLVDQDGKSRLLARSRIVEVPPLAEPGVYEIRRGEQVIGQFAVNFHDTRESTLTGLAPGRRQPAAPTRTAQIAVENPYSWIVLMGIALIVMTALLDWRVLQPNRR